MFKERVQRTSAMLCFKFLTKKTSIRLGKMLSKTQSKDMKWMRQQSAMLQRRNGLSSCLKCWLSRWTDSSLRMAESSNRITNYRYSGKFILIDSCLKIEKKLRNCENEWRSSEIRSSSLKTALNDILTTMALACTLQMRSSKYSISSPTRTLRHHQRQN